MKVPLPVLFKTKSLSGMRLEERTFFLYIRLRFDFHDYSNSEQKVRCLPSGLNQWHLSL
jgi:hypothetical protein